MNPQTRNQKRCPSCGAWQHARYILTAAGKAGLDAEKAKRPVPSGQVRNP